MNTYVTNISTGEMTPIDLSPLAKKPRGRVKRIQTSQVNRQGYPLRSYKKKARLNDELVLILMAGAGLALATVLFAGTAPSAVPLFP